MLKYGNNIIQFYESPIEFNFDDSQHRDGEIDMARIMIVNENGSATWAKMNRAELQCLVDTLAKLGIQPNDKMSLKKGE